MNRLIRKILGVTLSLSFIMTPILSTEAYAAQDREININIDGNSLVTDDKPFIYNERTLLPLRAVSEALGGEVVWDGENKRIDITKGNKKLTVFIDNRLLFYTDENGKVLPAVMDVAPIIKNERTYVPVRLVANCLGLEVDWDQDTYSVVLKDNGKGKYEPFYDMSIVYLNHGDTFTKNTALVLENVDNIPSSANQTRYIYLDKTTGKGRVVAACNFDENHAKLMPELEYNKNGVLAAIVVDNKGEFLAGTAYDVNFNVSPSVELSGITEGELVRGKRNITVNTNFIPDHIIYKFDYNNPEVDDYISSEFDQATAFPFSPPKYKNGMVKITAVAYDANGVGYESDTINAIVEIPEPQPVVPYLYLKEIDADKVGEVPVVLSVARNFDVERTVYYAENTVNGQLKVLEDIPWGNYSWYPGPDMKGTWNIYAKTTETNGTVKKSNVRTVSIAGEEKIILTGVGPNQVITDKISVNSNANVEIVDVKYVLSNPYNLTEKVLGSSADFSEIIKYTPTSVNEGERDIQAIATTKSGNTIYSDQVRIKIYLGEIYGSKPVTEKTNFINYVSDFAVHSQKLTGMAASIQIAQAVLETGWGQSIPVDRYSGKFSNNLFGIKGSASAGSVLCATREVYNGVNYYIDDYFRAYVNPEESWRDHQNLLLLVPRYKPYREVMYDYKKAAHALKSCGYATDPRYATSLIYLVEKYELWKYDEQGI